MSSRTAMLVLLLSSAAALLPVLAQADDAHRGWWHQAWREPYWERPCKVKVESKPGEFKREVKCRER